MRRCEFELNGQPMSLFKMGRLQYPAFSGQAGSINEPENACWIGGPIPVGAYYILQRESGGLMGFARDFALGRDKWFALYAADARVDDEVFCNRIKRGAFRLHPKGPRGASEGCVVIDSPANYTRLRDALLATRPTPIRSSNYLAYAILDVR